MRPVPLALTDALSLAATRPAQVGRVRGRRERVAAVGARPHPKICQLISAWISITRAAISTNQLSASVTFLFGVGKLENEFAIVKKTCAKCTGTQLDLTPLVADPRFKKILLEVDEKTAMVIKSTVTDPDGSENAISFLGLKTNVGINESHFKLTPPPGTQVQDFLTGGQATVPGKDAGP